MKDDEIEDSQPLVESFAIDSDERCEWYLKRLANLQAEEERIKEQSARMLANLKAEQGSLTARFGPEFEAYCRERIAGRRDKKKYHDFFNARVQVRAVPARLALADADAALAHAKSLLRGDLIKVTESVYAKDYLETAFRCFQHTGELLPGVDRVPEGESFSVRFPKGKGESAE